MAEKKKAVKQSTEKAVPYENNPFFIGLNGLNFVFEKAKGIAILLIVVSVLGVFSGFPSPSEFDDKPEKMQFFTSPEQWTLFIVIFLVLLTAGIFIGSMLSGMSAYTSARLAHGRSVKMSEAFHAVLDRFFSYIWLQIIIVVKVFLWSLLLIVPGIIMAVRYSLANVAFFDKNLRGNDAVKESLALTKGAWLTTFAGQALFNLVTLGVISELVNAGARTVLYRQFSTLGSKPKPATHALSWVTLFLPFALLAFFIMMIAMLAVFMVAIGAIDQ